MTHTNLIILVKGVERYVFVYDDTSKSRSLVQHTFGRFAANPDLSFTWYDAAVMSQKVKERARRHMA